MVLLQLLETVPELQFVTPAPQKACPYLYKDTVIFETRCWRRMLKIKWTDRIKNDEVFQRAKEERLLLKFKKNRPHSWIGHTIKHNEFVANIREGAIFGKNAFGRPRLQYLKQVARNIGADSYTEMKRMAYNKSRWKAANQSKD